LRLPRLHHLRHDPVIARRHGAATGVGRRPMVGRAFYLVDAGGRVLRWPPVRRLPAHRPSPGFILSEVLITVLIIGILTAIAVPNYINSLNKGRQLEAITQVSQIQSGIQSYADEFLSGPTGWGELGRVTSVMTAAGVATGADFSAITTPGGDYSLTVTASGSDYLIQASTSKGGANWNIAACVNTASGASQLTRGSGSAPAATPVCS
ncbi:MAG: type IV pilin protein, partial [Cyanobacteriota bacterium]